MTQTYNIVPEEEKPIENLYTRNFINKELIILKEIKQLKKIAGLINDLYIY